MLSVCVTTLNEADTIGSLVTYFRIRGHRVYVVDDGSSDDTVAVARVRGAIVQVTKSRQGIGPCLIEAWKMALQDSPACSHILQIDAGRSHRADEYPRLLGAAINLKADVVVGSRFLYPLHYDSLYGSRFRPYLSRLASLMCNLVQSGARYTDWTSGYRVFSRRAAEYLSNRSYLAKMHGWQLEVLAYAGEAGYLIMEEPIHYKAGRSSFNWSVAAEAFRTWLHIMHNVGWVGSHLGDSA